MVSIQLPDELTEDFISLIPKQREMIDELMNEGKILQYALGIDRSKLWITLSADTKKDVLVILSAFPLIDYMKPKIFELAFYNSISTELPKLIMN